MQNAANIRFDQGRGGSSINCFRRRKMLISNPKSNCSVPHSDSVSYLSLLVLLCYLQSSGEKVEKFQEDPSELRTRVSILCLG
ncbi:hypothetical protein SAY87_015532 [Trapa incisa]|uniref:Uncharacterized protein n=1 Tax=Trapa incisa TaxID=236973 RepID=A0AAN7GLT4_9MYRT|nr:hypothetical protein SAY87_015532 [Trapa incisa]